MAYKLQLKRGSSGSLPTGSAGEPLFTTDTNDLYIGTGASNQKFQKFIASGTSSQFLKGDGSLDSGTYQPLLNGTGFVKASGTTITYDNSTYYLASNPNSYITLSALSATTPLNYNNTSGAFTIAQASGSANGYLSSTDWTTFNNKQNALTNPVTGTGTTNYLPKWTSGSAIGNSNLINDSTGNIGLGVTPSAWGSTYKVLQFPGGYVGSDSILVMGLGQNFVWSGSSNLYVNNGFASDYYQYLGQHIWRTSPSGTAGNTISFIQSMTLNAGGNLQLGTTSGGNWRFLCYQNASTGSANSSALMARQDGSDDVAQFWVSGSNIASIKSNGNLLVGTTTDSGEKFQVSGAAKITTGLTISGNGGIVNGANIFNLDYFSGNARLYSLGVNTSTKGGFEFHTNSSDGSIDVIALNIASTGAATFSSDLTVNGVLQETVTTNRQTASYTLALTDRGKLVEMNVATANNLTVPLNSSIAFPIGTKIDLAQYGAGQTTVVATGGVSVRSAGGALKLTSQYSGATLVKIATDEWYLFGNITV